MKKNFLWVLSFIFILSVFFILKDNFKALIKEKVSKENVLLLRNLIYPRHQAKLLFNYEQRDSSNIKSIDYLNKLLVTREIEFHKIHDTIFELENQLSFDFQLFDFNSLFPSKNGISKNTTYVDVFEDDVFLVSGSGIFLKTPLKDIYSSKGNLSLINSNISDFVNYDEFYGQSWYGIKDIFIDQGNIYVSFSNQLEKDCFNTSILVAEINKDELQFEMFFEDSECIEEDNEYGEFNAHQSGGRITNFEDNQLLFSIGEYRYRTKAQDKESLFGKIISINKETKEAKIISMGNRNVQGLKFIKDINIILSTEHGPYGGDEINIQRDIDSIYNFGWPISSYGEHYSTRSGFGEHSKGKKEDLIKVLENAPLNKSHIDFGFTEPFKFFVPSIGISEIDYLKTDDQLFLLATSMGNDVEEGDMSIHVMNINKKEDYNIITLNKRIRDIIKINGASQYLLTFEGGLNGGGIGLLKKRR